MRVGAAGSRIELEFLGRGLQWRIGLQCGMYLGTRAREVRSTGSL